MQDGVRDQGGTGKTNGGFDAAKAIAAGRAKHMAGDVGAARAIYESVLTSDPGNADALHMMGLVMMQKGDYASALDYFDKAIQRRPDFAKAHSNRGTALMSQGPGYERQALDAFRRAVELDPDNAAAHYNRGAAAVALMLNDEALAAFRRAIDLNPKALEAMNNAGTLLAAMGRTTEAIEVLERALKIDPNFPEAVCNLALALKAAKRPNEAVQAFARAIRMHPEWPEAHFNLGNLLTQLGRFEEAAGAFRAAADLKADFADVYANLAHALKMQGKRAEAVEVLRRGAAAAPKHIGTRVALGAMLIGEGDAKGALAAFDAAAKAAPGATSVLAGQAIALNEAGDKAGAARLLDFDRFVSTARYRAPAAFGSMDAFTDALASHILAHPTLREEPEAHATRKGRHTGDLLSEPKGPIADLERQIRGAVAAYVAALPDDISHPFLARRPGRPDDFDLAMWAVVLKAEGHQVAHIHPTAWLSGVCYAKVPPVVEAKAAEHAGWIEFGRAPSDWESKAEPILRLYKPEVGLVVLFPSYVYHRTVPFDADELRISIAFDVMPR